MDKKIIVTFYVDYVKTNLNRDLVLEKKLWKLDGIFWFKLKKRIKVLRLIYFYKKYKYIKEKCYFI